MVKMDEFYHLRTFEDLLYDAVHLSYLAHDVDQAQNNDGYEFTYIRSSILNTLLLFECGANCCIDSLNLPAKFEEDIDKIPFLSKYEFFLGKINAQTTFDRGRREVQAVAELKAIRDRFVHPKVKKQRYSEVTDGISDADFGSTQLLKFPWNPVRWSPSHAVLALKVANEFFNLFFLSWSKFSSDTVCEILLSSSAASIPAQSTTRIDAVGGLDRAVRDWNIDFKFIGKKLTENGAG
jgi:hypothetical protein